MILIAIGANLHALDQSPPLTTCRRAVARIAALPGLRLEAVSRWYETAPVPPSGQPPYVNGAIRLSAAEPVDPAALLADLLAIEAAFGRTRAAANAARTLDLDLIAIGATVRDSPDPILPHPRAHLRRFVLVPLADVAAGWVHPRLGIDVRGMLAGLADAPMRVLSAPEAACGGPASFDAG
jgi:2-amino-4-hydroxy-6-hydroxymethyldihydropteridine diphosphokinase